MGYIMPFPHTSCSTAEDYIDEKMRIHPCLATPDSLRKHQRLATRSHEPLLNRAPRVLLHDDLYGRNIVVDGDHNVTIIDIGLMNMAPLQYAATFQPFMHPFWDLDSCKDRMRWHNDRIKCRHVMMHHVWTLKSDSARRLMEVYRRMLVRDGLDRHWLVSGTRNRENDHERSGEAWLA